MTHNVGAQVSDDGVLGFSSPSPDAVLPSGDDGDVGDDEMELFELDIPVVVTATRRPQRLARVPYAMSVVTADDIRRTGARSIPDALRLVPGVDVADLSFGNAAVSTRGFHGFISNQVLVLVDGRQIFDSFFGGTLWASWPFQLEDIARIEVVRGPGGVTWGANAMNGVINIITKDPADQLGFTLTSSGGSRGTFKQHVGYATSEGKLRWRLSGEYEASDGFRKGGSVFGNLNDGYKGGRIALHGVYEASPDDTFTFSLGSAAVDGGFPSTPLAGFGGKRHAGSQASFVLGTWRHADGPKVHHDLTVYVNDFQVSPGVSAIDYRYQQFGLLFSQTFEPSQGRTRTWGFDTRMDLLDAGNASPRMLEKNFVTAAIVGFYAQEEWRFAPRWTFDLGGRIDYDTYGGFQPSARASLSYEVAKDSIIYSAVSRAFQMPTSAGRFTNFPLLNGLTQVTADRGFDLTTLIAYEVGYRGRIGDKLDLTANAFWHDYDDVQAFTPKLGPPGLIQYNFGNAGSADLYGFEMDAKYAANDQLTLLANYTYQQLNWNASQPFTGRDYITPPKHKFMVGARYDATDDLHFSSNLFYVDAVKSPNPANPFVPRRIDPYYRVDLTAEYEFRNDHASITVGVKNLLDRDHYEGSSLFLNDAQTPRMIFAELRMSIR